jgi:murein DD-endopeptidase MepM/ murein hydrolase activator NlpD
MNNALIVRDDGGYRLRATVDAEAASRSVMQPEVQATSTTSAKVRNVGTTAEIPAAEPDDVPPTIAKLVIENGQSLYELFQQEKLSRIDLIAMTKADATTRRKLDRVRPGQVIHVRHRNGDIDSLRLAASRGDKDFLISRSLDGFSSAQVAPLPREPAAVTIRADASEPTPSSSAQGLAPRTDVTADDDRETSTAGLAGMPAVLPAAVVEHELEVQPGESLYLIFKRLQVPPSDLGRVMSNKEALPLKRLRPGQVLSLRLLSDNRLLSLSSDINDTRNISIVRQPDESMRVTVKDTPLERRTADATGLIEDSLFLSGQRAGLSDRVIMQLVEIFGWDVDFALDVRAGDRFTVVYEELYKDGTKVRDGNILAGEFINGGRQLRGVRFTDASGNTSYYSPDGLSMRKAFLRTPVSFSRISSRFSLARKHPVLNKIRAHKGVDYAAPRGTPIKSSGNGRVTFSGWRRGYGRTVKIQHGGKYETLYAHMTRIHPRAKPGKRVSQGEVIGYVGSTGLATGPHLHYEFRVNGVHKDPLRVKLPKALPIEDRYLADFKATARPLIAQLDLLARTRLAATD